MNGKSSTVFPLLFVLFPEFVDDTVERFVVGRLVQRAIPYGFGFAAMLGMTTDEVDYWNQRAVRFGGAGAMTGDPR